MSRNGSGVYSLPAGNPVVTGTTISSTWANTTLSDIATALTGSVASDGQTAMTGNLQMGNNKVTGLAAPTSTGDALSFNNTATVSSLTVTGNASVGGTFTLTGGLTLNGNVIVGDSSSDTLTVNATSTFAAPVSMNGGVTLGDASGDALTINSSAVSIPNGLNFDSNTFVIDATNNWVFVGKTESGVGTDGVQLRAGSYSGFSSSGSTALFVNRNTDDGTLVELGRNGAAAATLGISSSALTIGTGGSERMRITSTGNVGIGTSSPASRLHVAGQIEVTTDTTTPTSGSAYFYKSNVGATVSGFNAVIETGSAGSRTERMRITSTGNVGIGTSSPSNKLSVVGTSYFNVGTYATGYALTLAATTETTRTYQIGMVTGGALAIYDSAAAAQRLILDSSGNLGLGVTPSAWGVYRAFDIGSSALVAAGVQPELVSNGFFNGTSWLYKATGFSNRYVQNLSATGAHAWFNAASGTAGAAISFTQAMTLDASGNLGIGTTSPSSRLDVSGSGTNASALIQSTRSDLSITTAMGSDGGLSGGFVRTSTNHPLVFGTNNTERARINSSGEFSLGTTSSSFTANVGIKLIPDGRMGCVVNDATTGTNSYHLYNTNATNNGYRFYVNVNGGINNYSANNVNLSDRREKTDFAPAGEYLSKICTIPVQTYKYIDQSDNEKTLGVVAQDVQAVAPELVSEDNWGTEEEPKMRLSIYQTDLQYALMKCIQELKAELDTVKAELNTLKGN